MSIMPFPIFINGNPTTSTNTVWITVGPQTIQCDPPTTQETPPVEEIKEKSDGCTCKKCREYFPYAEPNQDDGTLICYACRHGY